MRIFWERCFVVLACAFFCFEVNVNGLLDQSGEPLPRGVSCDSVLLLDGYSSKCAYLGSVDNCVGDGYINYLYLFYCYIGRVPVLGYLILFLWILVLFYLLGDTASKYFCSALEELATLLKLSPTIAGVTLLSLGNGAPDLFSSLASFSGNGTDDVGFNTVLGGASFVTCVVAGVISILVRARRIQIDKAAFMRNIFVYFLALAFLVIILLIGKINLWGAFIFLLIYVLYVIIVWFASRKDCEEEDSNLTVPILCRMENGEADEDEKSDSENEAGSCEGPIDCYTRLRSSQPCQVLICLFETSLDLPRRLTIPVVCETRWSKPYFVSSMTLAPIFLSVMGYSHLENASLAIMLTVIGIAIIVSVSLGTFAYCKTISVSPPKDCLLIWLVASFIMGMIWSYMIAQELLGVLISLGYIMGISPSILGFTVLAWGNSISDLIINSTMALKGGKRGAQIAISGCYAGPIFNILIGLGLSLIVATWDEYPSPLSISWDPYLMQTIGFLVCGLVFAIVNVASTNGTLNAVLGGGLVLIYLISVSLRLIESVVISLENSLSNNFYLAC